MIPGNESIENNNIINSVPYTTTNLFKDFCNELKNYPLILSEKFPDRMRRFHGTLLSMFWKDSKDYINYTKAKIKRGKYQIPEEDLSLLEQRLKYKYGLDALECLEFIDLYKTKKINGLELIEVVKEDLGKRSKQIPVTNQELSLILTGTLEYVRKILKRIRLETDADYNPNYKIAKSMLNHFEDQFDDLLGPQAKKLKLRINRYINANPDLKDYPNQQYSITNPHYFSNLDTDSHHSYLNFIG